MNPAALCELDTIDADQAVSVAAIRSVAAPLQALAAEWEPAPMSTLPPSTRRFPHVHQIQPRRDRNGVDATRPRRVDVTVCAYGGTCPPEGCSLCRSPEPYPEPSIEDYCWPHPYYGDDMTAAIGSDEAVPIGRCYCGKQLYPAGGPKWPLSRPRRRGIHASSPPPGPWRSPSAPPPGGRSSTQQGGGGVDIVEELRRLGIDQTAAAAAEIERLRAEVARLTDLHERIAAQDDVAAAYQKVYFEDFPTVQAARSRMLLAQEEAASLRAELSAERALADRGAELIIEVPCPDGPGYERCPHCAFIAAWRERRGK